MRQNNLPNTKKRNQTPTQEAKMGQRKNNHRKNKLTTKQEDGVPKTPEAQPPAKK